MIMLELNENQIIMTDEDNKILFILWKDEEGFYSCDFNNNKEIKKYEPTNQTLESWVYSWHDINMNNNTQ